MSGRKIEDRNSWMGNGTTLSGGVKSKEMSHTWGAGALNEYEDTDEKIKAVQEKAVSKIKGQSPKSGYRH